ncbi:hypothetical protein BH10PAT1_BH10PAT1_0610 [soil metagenome]
MSPRIESFFNAITDLAKSTSQAKIDAKKQAGIDALLSGEFDKANQITTDLSNYNASALPRINAAATTFLDEINALGLNDVDFTVDDFLNLITRSEVLITEPEKESETKKRNFQIRPIIAEALLEVDEDGYFVHQQQDVIQMQVQNYNLSEIDAKKNFFEVRSQVKSNIKKVLEQNPNIKRIADLATLVNNSVDVRGKTAHKNWAEFYTKVIELYPDYEPQKFIDEIIYRRETNESEGFSQDLKPVYEIILSRAFLRKDSDKEIENLFGEKLPKDWKDELELSCEIACTDRLEDTKQTNISKNEIVDSRKFIEDFIHDLVNTRERFGGIRSIKNFEAFKLLYTLSDKFSHNPEKAAKLLHILFPDYTYNVDGNASVTSVRNLNSSSIDESRGAI